MVKFFKRLLGLYPLPNFTENNTHGIYPYVDTLLKQELKLIKPRFGPIRAPGVKNLHMRNYLATVSLHRSNRDTDILLEALGMTFSGDQVAKTYTFADSTVVVGDELDLQKGVIPVLYATHCTEYSSTLLEIFQKIKPNKLDPIQKLITDTMIKRNNLTLNDEDYVPPENLDKGVFKSKNLTGDDQYDLLLLHLSYMLFKGDKSEKSIKKMIANILLDNTDYHLFPALVGHHVGLYSGSDITLFIKEHLSTTYKRDRFNNFIPFALYGLME